MGPAFKDLNLCLGAGDSNARAEYLDRMGTLSGLNLVLRDLGPTDMDLGLIAKEPILALLDLGSEADYRGTIVGYSNITLGLWSQALITEDLGTDVGVPMPMSSLTSKMISSFKKTK